MGKKVFLFVMVWLAMAGETAAATLKQVMEVSIGVFDAAEIVLFYSGGSERFDIRAEVATAHLFDTLYPFTGRYASHGRIDRDRVIPEIYETYTQSRHHVRTKKIFYDKTGEAYKRVSTKDKAVSEKPITDIPKTADAADLQTVFATFIEHFGQNGDCRMTREVYDGKKHYKVIAENKGIENHFFTLSGQEIPAFRCAVYIKNLKNNNDNILWEVSADRPINFWIGRDEVTKLPFILEIGIDSTPLGALKVIPKTLEIK